MHCSKEQGIYSDLNLNVARALTEADGVTQAEALVDDILSQPYEQEWASRFKDNRPSWAKVLERPE